MRKLLLGKKLLKFLMKSLQIVVEVASNAETDTLTMLDLISSAPRMLCGHLKKINYCLISISNMELNGYTSVVKWLEDHKTILKIDFTGQ
jgi:hypothetical protein